jgi:hypothetical protein
MVKLEKFRKCAHVIILCLSRRFVRRNFDVMSIIIADEENYLHHEGHDNA